MFLGRGLFSPPATTATAAAAAATALPLRMGRGKRGIPSVHTRTYCTHATEQRTIIPLPRRPSTLSPVFLSSFLHKGGPGRRRVGFLPEVGREEGTPLDLSIVSLDCYTSVAGDMRCQQCLGSPYEQWESCLYGVAPHDLTP